ncbi:MAG: hypothetical protein AAB432_01385 [Patescibacteria group bacterium]
MRENFEIRALEHIDIDRAFAKAKKILAKETIRLDGFIGETGYFEDEVKADKGYVAEMEKKFEKINSPEQEELNKLATIFEAVIHEHAELSNWFGPDAFTIKTSRFDDIKNGVDTVVEFEETETTPEYLALAIDVTFSAETTEKFERIKKEIKNGELTEVKYFRSEHTEPKKLKKIPRVVIGAEAKTVKELGDLWLEGENKALGKHWIQFQILDEIIAQLKGFGDYARLIGKEEEARIYDRELNLAKKIYKQKFSEVKDSLDRDSVFYSLDSHARNFS